MKHLQSVLKALFIFFIDRIYVCFIQPGESICDPQDSDLFYDIYNTINKHKRGQTQYLSFIFPTCFDIFF